SRIMLPVEWRARICGEEDRERLFNVSIVPPPQQLPAFALACTSRSFCLPARKLCTRWILAGQIYAQEPHSMQSIRCIFSSDSGSFSASYRCRYSGIRCIGQTVTHLPQRIQWGFSFSHLSCWVKTTIALVPLVIGA